MIRTALAGCLCALVAVMVASGATLKPSLSVVAKRPLTIRGMHFQPTERVGVTIAAGGTRVKRTVTTNGAGSFRARFGVSIATCESFTVQAFGSLGSRARLLPRLQPACLPGYEP